VLEFNPVARYLIVCDVERMRGETMKDIAKGLHEIGVAATIVACPDPSKSVVAYEIIP
jgi:hypothetical protein